MNVQGNERIISLTGVLIPDQKTNGFTVYLAEFPEVIAQGSNKEEAKRNLLDAFNSILEFKKSEQEDDDEIEDAFTEQLNFTLR